MPRNTIHAVLFDLDGTLADTAPDLGYVMNRMRAARGLPALPFAVMRPYTSLGARGLLGVGLAASERIGVNPQHCIYLGDDRRDMEAGRAAGMTVVAARFGYLNGNDPEIWAADGIIDQPSELLQYL